MHLFFKLVFFSLRSWNKMPEDSELRGLLLEAIQHSVFISMPSLPSQLFSPMLYEMSSTGDDEYRRDASSDSAYSSSSNAYSVPSSSSGLSGAATHNTDHDHGSPPEHEGRGTWKSIGSMEQLAPLSTAHSSIRLHSAGIHGRCSPPLRFLTRRDRLLSLQELHDLCGVPEQFRVYPLPGSQAPPQGVNCTSVHGGASSHAAIAFNSFAQVGCLILSTSDRRTFIYANIIRLYCCY
jgi:site-specific DNA-cytosine methylase